MANSLQGKEHARGEASVQPNMAIGGICMAKTARVESEGVLGKAGFVMITQRRSPISRSTNNGYLTSHLEDISNFS